MYKVPYPLSYLYWEEGKAQKLWEEEFFLKMDVGKKRTLYTPESVSKKLAGNSEVYLCVRVEILLEKFRFPGNLEGDNLAESVVV